MLKPLSSNIGMKADDRFTLPLCREHHELSHRVGERTFWRGGVDPVLLSLALFSISGDEQEADRLITFNMVVRHSTEMES